MIPAHGDPFDQVLEGDSLVLGRSSAAELVLADRFLSRRHARLQREGETWLVEDLGSRNGTLLNGVRVEKPTKISAGDELRLSGSVVMVRGADDTGREVATTPSQESAQHTVFRRASDLISRQSSDDTAGIDAPEAVRRQADRLRLLNDVHRALNQSIELDDLLEMILARAFDELSPEEGVILLKDPSGEYYRAARRTLPGVGSKYAFSETLIHEVGEKGMAALVLDVETDERFAHAQSILSSGIRSLVAAPLLDAEGSLGMVALNSRVHKRQFDEEDMELLVSLASVAALRIRNVALAEEAAERRRLEEEMKLARQIQVGLLPSQLPEVPGYDFHGGNVPSRGVSGDYFQVEPRNGGKECVLVIADVSGKGIAASLLTASLEALSAGPIEVGQGAQEICEKVCRRLFHRTPPAKYATMILGILDPATHKLTYTNCGHNPALIVRADGSVDQLGTTGMPVGLMEVGNYSRGRSRVFRRRHPGSLHRRDHGSGEPGRRGIRHRETDRGLQATQRQGSRGDVERDPERPGRVRQRRPLCRRPHLGSDSSTARLVPSRTPQPSSQIVAIHPRDELDGDPLGTGSLAFTKVRARAEVGLHLFDHATRPLVPLGLALWQERQVRDLGSGEQLTGTVGALGDTSTAADALGRIHGSIRHRFGDGQGIGILRTAGIDRDESTRLDDLVERTAIDNEVLENREGTGAPGLDTDLIPVLELAHMKLTGRRSLLGTVGLTVDHQATGTADTLSAIMFECDGLFAPLDELFVRVRRASPETTYPDSLPTAHGSRTGPWILPIPVARSCSVNRITCSSSDWEERSRTREPRYEEQAGYPYR